MLRRYVPDMIQLQTFVEAESRVPRLQEQEPRVFVASWYLQVILRILEEIG